MVINYELRVYQYRVLSWTLIQNRIFQQHTVLSSGCPFHILHCKLILVSYQTHALLYDIIVALFM